MYQAAPHLILDPRCNVGTTVTVCNLTLFAIFSKRLKSSKINYNCSYTVDTVFTAIMILLVTGTVYHTRDSRVCERLEGEQMKQTLAL